MTEYLQGTCEVLVVVVVVVVVDVVVTAHL
jgi:hypothetical protein